IIFAYLNQGLSRVSATGGTPQSITSVDREKGEIAHRWPEIVPGGQAVLFTIWMSDSVKSRIGVLSLETGEWKTVLEGGSYSRYSPTGHLLYVRAETLMAAPFDLSRLEVTGESAPVLEGVQTYLNGQAYFDFASDGMLLYLPARATQRSDNLVWVDREGRSEPLLETGSGLEQPRFSPDGKRLAVQLETPESDIWIYEMAGKRFTPVTFEGRINSRPVWTPDGERLTFASNRTGEWNIFWMPADGSGEAEQLPTGETQAEATSWSPDGKVLAFQESALGAKLIDRNIWLLPLEGERKPQPFLRTRFHERHAMFSPDGRWIAFTSNRSGRDEIYVKAYPGEGGIVPISIDGGTQPIWARSGKELFYRNADKMMVVSIQTAPTFKAGAPRLLFEGSYNYRPNEETSDYDITPDGQRFVMVTSSEQERPARQVNVILNWFEELKRLVPTE
ncbi:hypothetical protein MYX65_08335, partial [Acidobacteria bacterium AH-259-L09]|nr:hypothetical protein [Acidobacteria bacterium AH-259-L09]